jgi:GH18 family chitinase
MGMNIQQIPVESLTHLNCTLHLISLASYRNSKSPYIANKWKRTRLTFQSLFRLDAFGYITPSTFEIGPMPGTDPSTFSDFTALKSRNPSLVAGISIGGWSFNDNNTDTQPVFGNIVSSSANRQTFISNLMAFMKHYGFDAVDIDWEYPGAPDRQPNQANSEADGGNYVLLLQEMRSAFNAQPYNWEISFTAPTSYWYESISLPPSSSLSFSLASPERTRH